MNLNPETYKQIVLESDPLYKEFVHANKLVENFIRDHDLVIYGGTAIDLAMRLKGKALYEDYMLECADYDFLSPEHANHAYKLVDLLASNGYETARSLPALHIGTMRVDMRDNHMIADISYIPPSIYPTIHSRCLKYDGMRIIHPDFQKLDVHNSLSFPYSGVPREVIFNRWKKDITRFNMLNDLYPTTISDKFKLEKLKPAIIGGRLTRSVLHGFAAYAVIYHEFITLMSAPAPAPSPSSSPPDSSPSGGGKDKSTNIISVPLVQFDGEDISFHSLDGRVDVVNVNPKKILDAEGLEYKQYRPYINMFPSTFVSGENINVYDNSDELLSVVGVSLPGEETRRFRVVCVQYLMKWFLAMGLRTGSEQYTAYYLSLLEMVNKAGTKLDCLNLSIKMYGMTNDKKTYNHRVGSIRQDLFGEKMKQIIPRNYKANTSKGIHPVFDYTFEVYRNDGSLINEPEEEAVEAQGSNKYT